MSQNHLDKALGLIDSLQANPSADDLAQKLGELKSALLEAQKKGEGQDAEALRQALEDLKVENSKFISVMVHEIRKPMTSIRGYSDMLGKNVMGELNEMQSQFVETIRKNTLSMEALVSDISDISKFSAGRVKPAPKIEMFKNIAMKLEKDLSDQAHERNISLNFDVPSGLPLLNTDGMRVEQALRKLIDNALKYSREGEGRVTLRAEGHEDKLHVIVQDNGVGMTEQEQSRLGELFFRGDNDIVTQTKGYGMGIPIALACVALVGGTLKWESAPNAGSTFTLILSTMPQDG